MKYKVISEEVLFDSFLKIKEANVEHDSFTKNNAIEYTREILEMGDCVAVLMYEKDTDSLIFINQFRYTTVRSGSGWFLELPAGILEIGENPEDTAIREVREETGYRLETLEHISTFYSTPGSCTEQMHLYYAEVTQKDRIDVGGGVHTENEDIELCKFKVCEIKEVLRTKRITDGKSIIALQWFLLYKTE